MKHEHDIEIASNSENSSGCNIEATETTVESNHTEPLSRFVLVEKRRLWRDCLTNWLRTAHPDARFKAFDTADECIEKLDTSEETHAIFICVEPHESSHDDIRKLIDKFDPVPVAVLSDSEDFAQFAAARESGRRASGRAAGRPAPDRPRAATSSRPAPGAGPRQG